MIRDFSREELEPVPAKNDTELTLGAGTILGLGGGFLLVCAVCFALGYTAGRRTSSSQVPATVIPASNAEVSPASSNAKPGAHGSRTSAQSQGGTDTAPSGAAPTATLESASAESDSAAVKVSDAVPDRRIKPALGGSNPLSSTDAELRVEPATAQVQGWMVQIAAVSRAEDAEVLVGALRKRGYSVSARRELGDNLIHVQTGPFVNRNDANAMRQKLLGDGYNAIVQ